MKNFRVQIRAYGYFADLTIVECEDNDKAFENALVDKLGQNDIVWEKDGFTNKSKMWITYEEVIDANTRSEIPIQKKRGLENLSGRSTITGRTSRYTLDMVRIDNKIREVINHIKTEQKLKKLV